jgi:hypothetical protein
MSLRTQERCPEHEGALLTHKSVRVSAVTSSGGLGSRRELIQKTTTCSASIRCEHLGTLFLGLPPNERIMIPILTNLDAKPLDLPLGPKELAAVRELTQKKAAQQHAELQADTIDQVTKIYFNLALT